MTNAKATKRALLSSALALFLCFAMLIGTTFAWFTDSVTSANNIITAGNLDIELKYAKIDGDTLTDWDTVGGKDNIFDKNALWGCLLEDLTIEEFKGYNELFENDVYGEISLYNCMAKRTSQGGTGVAPVKNQIAKLKEYLNNK